jgi:biotin operon repressor
MAHLFQHLIRKANHAPQRWEGITVERGQLICGRKSLSESTGISEQTIRTCLNRLKSTKEITIESTKSFSIITINNYEDYQGEDGQVNHRFNQASNQQSTNNQPTINQQLTTNNNDNNDKNVKNDKKYIITNDAKNENTERVNPRTNGFSPPGLGSNPGPLGIEIEQKIVKIAEAVNGWRIRHGLEPMPMLLDGTQKAVIRTLKSEPRFQIDEIMRAADKQPLLWKNGLFNLDWLTRPSSTGDPNFKLVLNYQWQAEDRHGKTNRER